MSGTLKIGGKTLATHNSNTNTVTLGNASVDETFSGMMEVDQWYLTGTVGDGVITTNWARNDFTGFAKIGTGLTESSGVFSFPRTGVYEIIPSFVFTEATGGDDNNVGVFTRVSVDNGTTYYAIGHMQTNSRDNNNETTVSSSYIINVNSISGANKVTFNFLADSVTSGNYVVGLPNTYYMRSNFTVKRLGPAQ